MNTYGFRSRLLIVLCAIALSTQAAAQVISAPDTAHPQPLFNGRDVVRAVGFTGLTIAMFPLDRSLARRLTNEKSKANRFLNGASKGVEYIADPGSIVIGTGLYLFGRFTNHPGIEDLGWHGTEAVLAGSAAARVLKGLAGPPRPFVTRDTT